MVDVIENIARAAPAAKLAAEPRTACFHCGEPCDAQEFAQNEKSFCCHGCLTVHELLIENGLGHFYDLRSQPGTRMRKVNDCGRWGYLDEPKVKQQLVDFSDENLTRIT